LTRDRSLSEDLVQETFMRILKYKDSYRNEAKFSTWMYQIARHLHLDHLRQLRPEVPLEQIEAVPDLRSGDAAAGLIEYKERELLGRAMARLPLKNREILLLSRFQGLKHSEIADILGCSSGSVKVQVHRAVLDLRRIYHDLAGGTT
jgi:RNA polymerase sigma-70 factor (ECF subfamily)